MAEGLLRNAAGAPRVGARRRPLGLSLMRRIGLSVDGALRCDAPLSGLSASRVRRGEPQDGLMYK